MSLMSAIRRLVGNRSAAVSDLVRTAGLPDNRMTGGPRPPRQLLSAPVTDHDTSAPVRPDRAYHGPRGAAPADWPGFGERRDARNSA